MRKWLRDRPWIWLIVLLAFMMSLSVAFLVIAEYHRPVLVK